MIADARKRRSRRQLRRDRPGTDAYVVAASVLPPRRPRVLLFQPWDDVSVIAGERYMEEVSHTDSEITIIRHRDGLVIQTTTIGEGVVSFRVANATPLEVGSAYIARIRYQNAGGWSAWSHNFISTVPPTLDYLPINVPDEPETAGEIPIIPDEPITITRERRIVERLLETGHVKRRPAHAVGRPWTTFQWAGISATDRDTLVAFLEARIAAAEAFTVTDAGGAAAGVSWLTRRGSLEVVQTDPTHYTVRVEADGIVRDRRFTIGLSSIDGPDRFRL